MLIHATLEIDGIANMIDARSVNRPHNVNIIDLLFAHINMYHVCGFLGGKLIDELCGFPERRYALQYRGELFVITS